MYAPFTGALLCGVIVATAGAPATRAHDLHGLVAERNALDPDVRAKFDEINEVRRLLAIRSASNPQDGQLEAVVQTALKWPGNRASVCFFDGRKEARDHVADVASRWTQATGLQFDFGPAGSRRTCDATDPSDIRVSFRGSGYWSYVGTQAKYISARKQTLNLQRMDKTSFTAHDDGVVLHEFGHAIGFEHEHQSPVSGCQEEFNWNYLYVAMGWSKEEVDRNMRRLDDPSSKTGLLTTAFDRQSVMLYSLEPEAFHDPATAKCYIPQSNDDISNLDRQAAAAVYPAATSPMSSSGRLAPPPATPDAVATVQSIKRVRDFSQGPKGR